MVIHPSAKVRGRAALIEHEREMSAWAKRFIHSCSFITYLVPTYIYLFTINIFHRVFVYIIYTGDIPGTGTCVGDTQDHLGAGNLDGLISTI